MFLGVSPLGPWENIKHIVPNYVWPEDIASNAPKLLEEESSENKKGKKKEKKRGKRKTKMLTGDTNSNPFILAAKLRDMRYFCFPFRYPFFLLPLRFFRAFPDDYIPGLTPCWDSFLQIVMTRDIPWNKPVDLQGITINPY